jgi:hypothetical protein
MSGGVSSYKHLEAIANRVNYVRQISAMVSRNLNPPELFMQVDRTHGNILCSRNASAPNAPQSDAGADENGPEGCLI